jgi:hypothetical protein
MTKQIRLNAFDMNCVGHLSDSAVAASRRRVKPPDALNRAEGKPSPRAKHEKGSVKKARSRP